MKYIYIIFTAFIICSLFFIGGHYVGMQSVKMNLETVTVLRIDTVMHEKVIPKQVTLVKTVVDTFYSTDTVLAEVCVPINRYVFSDSLYRAEISGYRVSLDKMEVYNREVTNTVIKRVPKRWGLGVSAGYSFTPQGFQPYVGVGVNYNVITF